MKPCTTDSGVMCVSVQVYDVRADAQIDSTLLQARLPSGRVLIAWLDPTGLAQVWPRLVGFQCNGA